MPNTIPRPLLRATCALLASSVASAQLPPPWADVWLRVTLSQARDTMASTTVGSQVLFTGGYSSTTGSLSDRVDVYDADTDTWSAASLSVPRIEHAAASAGSLALFASGLTGPPFVASITVDIYDSASGTWSVSQLSAPREWLAGAGYGSLAFFGGGTENWPAGSDAVDIYDADTGTWSTDTLSVGRAFLAAASAGGKVVFAGGGVDLGTPAFTVYDTVDIYDVPTGTWSNAALSAPRILPGDAATAVGSKIFFAGGYDVNFLPSDVVDIYDTGTDTWSTAKLSQARGFLAATTVGDKAIFAGGTDLGTLSFDTVDVYDASTDTWSQDTLSVARGYLSAETARGRVMVAGGWKGPDMSFKVVDVFDYAMGASYCGPAVPNSTGAPGRIQALGSDVAADNDLVLTATELRPMQFGYFLTSETQGFLANPGGSQGNLCLGGKIGRYNRSGEIRSTGVGGMFSLWLDLTDTPQPLGPVSILAGETWNFTAWYRDVNPVQTSNFTDAVSVLFR